MHDNSIDGEQSKPVKPRVLQPRVQLRAKASIINHDGGGAKSESERIITRIIIIFKRPF